MAHQRETIRDAVVTMLTGVTDAGSNVFPNRQYNLQKQSELPAILVNSGEETAELRSTRPNTYIRHWSLNIDVVVEDADEVDNAMDSIAKDIEDEFKANTTVSNTCMSATLKSTSAPEILDNGERPVGVMTLVFDIQYTY